MQCHCQCHCQANVANSTLPYPALMFKHHSLNTVFKHLLCQHASLIRFPINRRRRFKPPQKSETAKELASNPPECFFNRSSPLLDSSLKCCPFCMGVQDLEASLWVQWVAKFNCCVQDNGNLWVLWWLVQFGHFFLFQLCHQLTVFLSL